MSEGDCPTSFDWQHFDEQLAFIKLDQIARKKKQGYEDEEHQLERNPNLHKRLRQELEMRVRRADEQAQEIYEVYCEVWELQGNARSPSFLRTVFAEKIASALKACESAVVGQCALLAQRTGVQSQPWFSPCLEWHHHQMQRLFTNWARKVEGDVKAFEYKAATVSLPVGFEHSPDYRGIRFNGATVTLTRNQATIVKCLHEAFTRGAPDVGKSALLAAVESETSRLQDFFRHSRLWNTLIVSRRRGTYRLNL